MAGSLDREASSHIGAERNVVDSRPKEAGNWRRIGPRAGVLLLLLVAALTVLLVALSRRAAPARCPEGRVELGHRCCWEAQRLEGTACAGEPRACTLPYIRDGNACRIDTEAAAIAGGELRIAPSDWQAQGLLEERTLSVESFRLDRTEVSVGRAAEPFQPLRNLSAGDADAACHARGGRLPTRDEWIFAASGSEGRRYPWGQTGLVCRRAVYGLIEGPCAASEHAGPDDVASRPDGATPDGVLDLVGNVAEWVRAGDGYVAMGGSFRSELASELKVWSERAVDGPRDDVGFRCAYDAEP